MYRPKRKHNTLRWGLVAAGTAVAVGAAALFFSDSEPEHEVVKPGVVKVTKGQDGRTYLDGCFKRFNKVDPIFPGADMKYEESSRFGTLALTTTAGDEWSLMFQTANQQGRDTTVPMSQLGSKDLQTYDTKGKSFVRSDEHNGKVYDIACRQYLSPGVDLDPILYGQFLSIGYDGEGAPRVEDVPHYRGNAETAWAPLNGTTALAKQPLNSPTRVHVTTVETAGQSLQIPVQKINLTAYQPLLLPNN